MAIVLVQLHDLIIIIVRSSHMWIGEFGLSSVQHVFEHRCHQWRENGHAAKMCTSHIGVSEGLHDIKLLLSNYKNAYAYT